MSETEFERLYQEFVRRGGGKLTLDGVGRTPAEYYDILSDTTLSLEEQEALNAAQEQYNRQSALNTIASELTSSSAFNNPYDSIATGGINSFTDFQNSPEYVAMSGFYNAITTLTSMSPNDALNLLTYLGIQSLIDQDRSPFAILTIPAPAINMYQSLQSHTNSQISNLPQTLQDASSLAGMNAQFGETNNSCDLFNQLMGILSGIFDGALDFLGDITSTITSMLSPFLDVLNGMISTITDFVGGLITNLLDAIGSVLGPLKDALMNMFGALGNIASQISEVISSIANQIANEAAGLLNMLEDLMNKAKALAMAAAAFDPCQLAVLMNVGGPAIQSAMSMLSTPAAAPAPTVPTQTDTRANPTTVAQTMETAMRSAQTAPGVPQSPFTALAALYQPMSAYLHSKISEATGILSEAFQTISNATGNVSIARVPQPNLLGSQSGNVTGDSVPSQRRNAPNIIRSTSHDDFTSQYASQMLQNRNGIRMLRIDIEAAIASGSLSSTPTALTSARSIIEQLNTADSDITNVLTTTSDALVYQSSGSSPRSEENETRIAENYNTVLRPRVQRSLNRSTVTLQNLTTQWNSIKPN